MSVDAVAETYSTAIEKAVNTLSSASFFLPSPVTTTSGARLYVHELMDYSAEAQERIKRGLSQVGSVDRGSFIEHLD
jgi:hypothetical protein